PAPHGQPGGGLARAAGLAVAAEVPVDRGGGSPPRRAGHGDAARDARSGDARGALRDRAARVGAGPLESLGSESGDRLSHLHRQGLEGANRAAGRAGGGMGDALPARRARTADEGTDVALAVRQRTTCGSADTGRLLEAAEAIRDVGG